MTVRAEYGEPADYSFFEDIPLPPISETASGRRWALKPADARAVTAIVQRNGVDPQLARILSARDVPVDSANEYLNPKLRNSLPDPLILKDMDRASDRLTQAVLGEQNIGVFGDYDVDGTTAAAILHRYFAALGIEINTYLPDRIAEGYGPSAEAFQTLVDQGADVIVTVDCGATAHDAVNAGAAAGADIVILDHHLMAGPAPEKAYATVNPNRPDDISGLTNLSAAGVAYLTVIALNRQLRQADFFKSRSEPNLIELLDLVALGLVCDVMPMTGVTRALVAQGLKVLDAGGNKGLSALARRAGAQGDSSTYHLGFLIGPRINAAGRIGHARLAFELMTTNDKARATALAEKLHLLNAERQAIEAEVQQQAIARIESDGLSDDEVIVAAGDGWHPGVIGIVAGRLKERFDKPAIVIGLDNGVGKGSGRSVSGVDLGSAIKQAAEDGVLIAGGGHAMAAGLTVAEDAVSAFRRQLNDSLGDGVREARKNRTKHIDAVVGVSAVTKSFSDIVASAGPFGVDNPEPAFVITDLRIVGTKVVGDSHLAVTLEGGGGERVRAIAFRAKDEPLGNMLCEVQRVHIAGKIRADSWRGGDAGQFQIEDVSPAAI